MSLADITEFDMESLSSTGTRSEGSEGVRTGDERVNIPIAAPPIEGVKHTRFFFNGDLVTFLVEGTLYRVHEYLLTANSPFWSEKLNARVDRAACIKLEDVATRDLDALLTILYDTNFHEYDLKTTEDWESVLRLATRWQLKNIRTLAITQLDPLATPLQKLVMARAFDVPKWLQPSLLALCMRPGSLTLVEGKQLSTEDLISITSTREAVRQKTQVTPAEQDVPSYIAKHILHTEPIGVFVAPATFSTKPLVPAAASSTTPQSIQAPATPSASIAPTQLITSATPVHSTPTSRSGLFGLGLGAPVPGPTSRSVPIAAAPPTASAAPAPSTSTSQPSLFGSGAPTPTPASSSPFGLAQTARFTSTKASPPTTSTMPAHSTPTSGFSFGAFVPSH